MNAIVTPPDFSRHRVALIDCGERHLASLEKSLQRLGIRWVSIQKDDAPTPDDGFAAIVELDSFNSPNALARLRERAVPICALTQHETLSQIQRGVALGATAILNRPITQGSVYTTLMMALSLQRRLDELHAQNAALRHKLDSGPLVAQAIARLIVELNVSEDAAYERIRARSMATHRSIADVCVEILAHAADHRRSSS
ncbi:ANTAR domain-containing response regulator [Paraburkholderia caballeronis]|uniref:ANTAR domain-containing protein n=1 Tax=Paraburkholderia caballeronis TaxID=416943 RepID=A0A1H7RUT4_9BURK|nr:ANTAR domain-containing protein [Paraburkholderia caballeronis]PXW23191.1 ANTAR domain-containing protein [Paraburkholderia caballeronis]PXW97855.1 ANTAR domain-containing protein [Paraburkholderia caballeronis]RAJ94825.1 ANTAR domain-containing protein [Paraburkholderia caballeronis]SEE63084.1 ANTAR domain-containing protein [Paraburkholderia caballeronis]SEL63187.1 ANTAR domain-containing protein [Paraburkholderia caballeronis]